MKRIIFTLLCMLALSATAQNVTRTQHRAAVAKDAVTTGTMTIRKPDYISISTDGGKELLIMEGTKFTMTMGGKKHVTDSRKNNQFATFHAILEAIINGQPIPEADDVTKTTKGGLHTITITPKGKKRQLFTSFLLVVAAKTSPTRHISMSDRKGDYPDHSIK